MTAPAHWLTARDDPRVKAALAKRCGLCGAAPGHDCAMRGAPLLTGIVHQGRVPEKALFGTA